MIRAGGDAGDVGEIIASAARSLQQGTRPTLRRAINATGVIIHTNLGRAPLSDDAIAAMREVAEGYSNLEYDLELGERGSRHEHVVGLLRAVTGAESGLVVNNNASALLLVLACLARGREVIISRGQLVEIGGGFRIPDVMRQSQADLVEVGTTNRTYASDYEAAISERTALLMRVHQSNFRQVGFVHQPSIDDLVEVGRRTGVPVVDDLGSGALLDTSRYGLDHEPMVQESIRAGADLVCFSGDKLLGGPQAGIIVGREDLVSRLRRHPLTRALRPGKLELAALGATLVHYLRGEAETEVPVWRMIAATPAQVEDRAQRLSSRLSDLPLRFEVVDGHSAVGGGSLPGGTLPTRLLALVWPGGPRPGELAHRLRRGDPPVVARVEKDRLVLDLRTVLPREDADLERALRAIVARDDC